MQAAYRKLKDLLWQMFQFDAADLDFGIYRILNLRRTELTRFLDEELLPQVRVILGGGDRTALEAELRGVEERARELGVADVHGLAKWKELRAKLDGAPDTDGLANEVFADLATFFARYYDDGDFLSLPRWNKDVYAIPYDGSEVKLHWANADQYYVKTTESFSRYAAEIEGAAGLGGKLRIELVVVTAESERDNTKATGKRRFVLADEDAVAVEGTTLRLRFAWRTLEGEDDGGDGKRKAAPRQDALNAETEERVRGVVGPAWKVALGRPAGEEGKRTVLGLHLYRFTRRNTSDYFIHKDLGGFLRRELDHYLKTEVLRLDDLEEAGEGEVEAALRRVRAGRAVGRKIIDWLAQIEDFQKRLFLKKKFVLRTEWAVTLDRVPRELWGEILGCEAQRRRWEELFDVSGVRGDLVRGGGGRIDLGFLEENDGLLIETKYLGTEVVQAVQDCAQQTWRESESSLLLAGENFQALRLLDATYRSNVDCGYFDPPYNTSEETFIYKNSYRHSSWLAMMWSRIRAAMRLLSTSCALVTTIDDEELYRLKALLDDAFGASSYLGTIVVQSNPRGRGINSHFATSHEYCLCYAPNPELVEVTDRPLTAEQTDAYKHTDEDSSYRLLPFRRSGGLSTPDLRPNSEFSLYYSPTKSSIVAVGGPRLKPYPASYKCDRILVVQSEQTCWWPLAHALDQLPSDVVAIDPLDTDGQRRVWRWSDRNKIMAAAVAGDFVVKERNGTYSVLLKDREKAGRKPKTIWADSRYDASSHGTNLLKAMFAERQLFGYPKAIHATRDALHAFVGENETALVLDVFAGSGTTGHAVINLNREDGGNRRFILVEMGEHFDSVLVPRILKATYSKDWKDGKPVDRQGVSATYKIQYLESYDDTLENIELRRDPVARNLLEHSASLREDYTLRYLLDLESRGSLLDLPRFRKPWDYRIKVRKDGVVQDQPVDLVETFNYLVGLHVDHVSSYGNEGILFVEGRVDGQRALVIWRDCDAVDDAALNALFRKAYGDVRGSEYERIWVNGDNQLENARLDGERWKVRLTEEDFHARMFDTSDAE